MKHIMISIKPEWTAKILNGEKTIEIRKSMPKCELPCKVYIYCTRAKNESIKLVKKPDILNNEFIYSFHIGRYGERYDGKVVAEFTLNSINKFDIEGLKFWGVTCVILDKSRLTRTELQNYLGDKLGYAWHIDDLKIYDKPKELSDFVVPATFEDNDYGLVDENNNFTYWKRVQFAPQSWCYVEGESK